MTDQTLADTTAGPGDLDRESAPALWASRASWAAVQSRNKADWLALMGEDVVIEDPIGPAITNPDGTGVRGREAVSAFYDANIAVNRLSIECEQTFPSSDPTEVAHVMRLTSRFDDGLVSIIRGVFTYRTGPDLLLRNLRGYWHIDDMVFERETPKNAAEGGA